MPGKNPGALGSGGAPALPSSLRSCFPSALCLGGNACAMAAGGIYLDSAVRLTAFLSTFFLEGYIVGVCSMQSWPCLPHTGKFSSLHGASCWKYARPNATRVEQHWQPLLYLTWRWHPCAQAKNLGPAFPDFRGGLIIATSQVII